MSEPTKTKGEVRYRPMAARAKQQCGNCSMFTSTDGFDKGKCSLVQGEIDRDYVCDRWEPRR